MENREEFDNLLADSALAAIDPDAPLMQIETALRSLGETMAKADPLRRAIVREAAIRRLRAAGVRSPAALADTAFGPVETADFDTTIRRSAAAPWNETVDGGELLDEIARTIRRFVVLPSVAADAQALWCLHTYTHEVAAVSPILCIGSPEKRCGKTRNLEVLSGLVHRPLHTANITVAALYRTIDRYQPTLLIDEADTMFVNGSNAELRGVLNAGLYKSNAFVLRCGDRKEPKMHSIWCPKAIALIGRLPTTLEDRSIVIALRRRSQGEPVETFRYDQVLEQVVPIRSKAVRWTVDYRNTLRSAIPAVSEQLNDRAQDLWRPLVAIAETVGGDWPERARRAALELSSSTREHDRVALQLLHNIRMVFRQQHAERLPSEEIVNELVKLEHRRFSEGVQPQAITKVELARLLAPFGIRPRVIRHGHGRVRRGYLATDFADAFVRYLEP
jgi:putative DNA primase/helicase